MLVGHEPVLSSLAALLLTGSVDGARITLKKGGVHRRGAPRDGAAGATLEWVVTRARSAPGRRRRLAAILTAATRVRATDAVDPGALLLLMDLNMQEMYRELARWTPGGFVVERRNLVWWARRTGRSSPNGDGGGPRRRRHRARGDRARVRARRAPVLGAHARARRRGARRGARVGRLPPDREHAGHGVRQGGGEPPIVPPELEIRPVRDDRARAAYADVMAEAYAVYGAPESSTRLFFDRMESVASANTRRTSAGSTAGRSRAPRSTSRTGSAASAGVGTHPRAFGRGYRRRAHVGRRHAGLQRGVTVFNLQASPMGAPCTADRLHDADRVPMFIRLA